MTHTVPNGTTYTIHASDVLNEVTNRHEPMWFADNFAYYARTKDELIDMLDYMTETWTHQTID